MVVTARLGIRNNNLQKSLILPDSTKLQNASDALIRKEGQVQKMTARSKDVTSEDAMRMTMAGLSPLLGFKRLVNHKVYPKLTQTSVGVLHCVNLNQNRSYSKWQSLENAVKT